MTDPLTEEVPVQSPQTAETRADEAPVPPADQALPEESRDLPAADPLPEESSIKAIDELEPDEDVDEFANELSDAPPAVDEFMAAVEEAAAAPAVGFYDAGPDLHALDDLTLVGRPGVLERLGPAHFRSKGFSFMGFLQTVYDHVAGDLNKAAQSAEGATPASPDA